MIIQMHPKSLGQIHYLETKNFVNEFVCSEWAEPVLLPFLVNLATRD